jgi:hypothetical protein
MTTPNEFCPRFERCSVNACPLHPDYPELTTSPLDPETICRAQRNTRLKIAKQFPDSLKLGGLTVNEHRRKTRRENRTPREIQEAIEWGKMMREIKALKTLESKGI